MPERLPLVGVIERDHGSPDSPRYLLPLDHNLNTTKIVVVPIEDRFDPGAVTNARRYERLARRSRFVGVVLDEPLLDCLSRPQVGCAWLVGFGPLALR